MNCQPLFLTNSIMYPYHNKIKQRIKQGELKGFEFIDKYKQIKPCLLLYFDTEPVIRPIREYRWKEYKHILKLKP